MDLSRDRQSLEGVNGLRKTDPRGHRLPAFSLSADCTANDGHTHDQGCLRLKPHGGLSHEAIARSLSVCKGTVAQYVALASPGA